MKIRPVQPADAAEWLRMRLALWPDSNPDKEQNEITHFLARPAPPRLPTLHAVFVAERPGGRLAGLVEVSVRPYADGCETIEVGYLEAWYVDPDARGQGIGRGLVFAAEHWAYYQGCREMASDAELSNTAGHAAHEKLGYRETGRVVQYCKPLHNPKNGAAPS